MDTLSTQFIDVPAWLTSPVMSEKWISTYIIAFKHIYKNVED